MTAPEITDEGLGEFAAGIIAMGAWGYSEEDTSEPTTGARYLDTATMDYATDRGRVARGSAARQQVITAVANLYRSSMAVRGVQFAPKHDENTQRYTDQELQTVLQPIIDAGVIEMDSVAPLIVRVQADGIPGRLGVGINFIDPLTGQRDTVEL